MSSAANLGDTGSVTLITALPGSGKSLRLVSFMKEAMAAGETIACKGVNGLKLPHLAIEDVSKWRDLPANTVLVVDEAHDDFPANRGEPPEWMAELKRIRHYGIRLILATQNPSYIHSFVRGLVGPHEHLVRLNGREASTLYRSQELMPDVLSQRARQRYDVETFTFPKENYDLYTSAQVHTVKYRMSSRMKRGLALAAVVVIGGAYFVYAAKRDYFDPATGEPGTATAATPALPASGGAVPVAKAGQKSPLTAGEYALQLNPVVEHAPWSAPAFSGRQVVSEPRAYCMASGPGRDASGKWRPASVTCLTEQGTRYQLSAFAALEMARHGEAYNPYKRPELQQRTAQREPGAGRRPAETGGTAAAPVGAGLPFGSVAAYGGHGLAPETAPR